MTVPDGIPGAVLIWCYQEIGDAGTIARRLNVSIATVSRAIKTLRREGFKIISVRSEKGWSYRVEEDPNWENDPAVTLTVR